MIGSASASSQFAMFVPNQSSPNLKRLEKEVFRLQNQLRSVKKSQSGLAQGVSTTSCGTSFFLSHLIHQSSMNVSCNLSNDSWHPQPQNKIASSVKCSYEFYARNSATLFRCRIRVRKLAKWPQIPPCRTRRMGWLFE